MLNYKCEYCGNIYYEPNYECDCDDCTQQRMVMEVDSEFWSIHGACGECSIYCPGYTSTSEYYELEKNRKRLKKYNFIRKKT